MRRPIVLIAALATLVAVTGCLTGGGDDNGGPFWALPCNDPVPFEQPGAETGYAGYIVYVHAGLDVAAEAARITAQCAIPLDKLYSDFFTIPKVNETQIPCLRCDPAVEHVYVNAILLPM